MSPTKAKHDYIWKIIRTDCQTALTLVEQNTSLESDQLQAERQVRNQPRTLVRRLTESGLVSWQVQGWLDSDGSNKEETMNQLDGDD